ncbi:MAG: hypothetical protein M3R15_09055, partial [Acidobacteriota bacterium]|nr:hypothetical protein [Acidobacteriota bacterium]
MSEKDNPAERLYRLLTEARKKNDGYVRDMIVRILGLPSGDGAKLLEATYQFSKLFDDVAECLRSIEG